MTMPDLRVSDLTVRFGGLVAVSGVSLRAEAGQVTGLIGPNGAGKTTTFNACCGVVSAPDGRVELGGERIDHLPPSTRARRGLGRSFQRMELFDSMTVAQNVALGPEALYAGRRPWAQLVGSRAQRQDIALRSESAMDRCGVADLAARTAGDLSTGQRRLVELARAIATPFRFLLLDEPSSGLDPGETERFGEILRDFVTESGIGILLVEHDMELVASVCTTLYVLDFGQLIFSGTTREALSSDLVKAAYLGDDAVEDAVGQGVPVEAGRTEHA